MHSMKINFPNKEMRKTFIKLMKTGGLEEDILEGLQDFSDAFAPEGAEQYDITFDYPSVEEVNITFENVE